MPGKRPSPPFSRRPKPSTPRTDKPPVSPHVTTLWDYPSQNYGTGRQGDEKYPGVTPSHVVWNLVHRYAPNDALVVDPFCGSGTTLDVCRDLGRQARGFDLAPTRPEIERADARKLPVAAASVDLVFMDPPYGTHIDYSDDPRCIGKLPAHDERYYHAMSDAFGEAARILKPGGVLGVYVADSYVHKGEGKGFWPIGYELFGLLLGGGFEPVDWVAVVRRNKTLEMGNYRKAADEGGFFLRGFNHLLIVRSPMPQPKPARRKKRPAGGR
ncbi:MAG: DNA methyltransferase [Planctomycetota bacterium]